MSDRDALKANSEDLELLLVFLRPYLDLIRDEGISADDSMRFETQVRGILERRDKKLGLQYEKYTTMMFSTAHISYADRNDLDRWDRMGSGAAPAIVESTKYGWRVFVHLEEPADRASLQAAFPPHILKMIDIAIERGCKWVEFDQDGEKYPGLEEFQW